MEKQKNTKLVLHSEVEKKLARLLKDYPDLKSCEEAIRSAYGYLRDGLAKGHKLLLCGNGGSAADCEHIVGELVKSFRLPRSLKQEEKIQLEQLFADEGVYLGSHLQRGMEAFSLVNHVSLSSAISNDVGNEMVYAQQVYACGKEGDVLLAFSTSGKAQNIAHALRVAKWRGLKSVGFSGSAGGEMKALCDCCICVPEEETYRVQERHVPVYHFLCESLEVEFFAD